MKLTEQLAAARLSMADVETASNGVLTINKLKKASSGEKDLSVEDRQLLHRVIVEHRMATQHLTFIVIPALDRFTKEPSV